MNKPQVTVASVALVEAYLFLKPACSSRLEDESVHFSYSRIQAPEPPFQHVFSCPSIISGERGGMVKQENFLCY